MSVKDLEIVAETFAEYRAARLTRTYGDLAHHLLRANVKALTAAISKLIGCRETAEFLYQLADQFVGHDPPPVDIRAAAQRGSCRND